MKEKETNELKAIAYDKIMQIENIKVQIQQSQNKIIELQKELTLYIEEINSRV